MVKSFNHESGDYLDVNGAVIYYEETGNESGPVLLLLHGGFGQLETFNPIIPYFSSKFRIIGIDSRGHGKSTMGSSGLSYELMQNDVEQVLTHLEIDSLTIIGFSDGGIVGYRLAGKTSLNILKLVTIGSRWHVKNNVSTSKKSLEMTGSTVKEEFPHFYHTYQHLNPTPDFNLFTQSLVEMWLDPGDSGHPNESVTHITCPLLIVRGDNDVFISLKDVTELSELVKTSTVLNIPFAGHKAFEDQPEIFLKATDQFLEQTKPKP